LAQNSPVLASLGHGLRAAVTSAVGRIKSAFREATRPLPLVAGFAMDLTRSRKELLAENAFLRQQLIVASRRVKRARLPVTLTGTVVRYGKVQTSGKP
jgi:hypothetical protein